MPIDPYFTSAPNITQHGKPRRRYSAEDRAEAARLHALPFNTGEDSVYHKIRGRIMKREHVSNGEFLFVMECDNKRRLKHNSRWHDNFWKYRSHRNVLGGGFSNLHKI